MIIRCGQNHSRIALMPIQDVTNTEAVSNADQAYKFVKALLCKFGVPHFIAQFVAAGVAAFVGVLSMVVGWIFAAVIQVLGVVTATVFKLISLFRKEGMQEFDSLTLESLSELLGVELDQAKLKAGSTPEIALENARAIGQQLHNRLFTEFTRFGKGTPGAGQAAAQAFTGYVTRFAMMNALTSLLADSLSLHHITQFRELGEEVATNLGLGRLHRRALTPLIDNAIVKPYDRELREQFRQDHLTDVQYVRAYQSGRMDLPTMTQELGWKGYPQSAIDELVKQLEQRLSDSEIETLLRYQSGNRPTLPTPTPAGKLGLADLPPLSLQDAQQVLINQGLSPDLAKQRIIADGLKRADSDVSAYVQALEDLAYLGFLDPDAAKSAIAALPLSPEELHYKLAKFGTRLENPRKRLTKTEVFTAYENGVVDLDYFQRWMDGEGYGEEDQTVLLYELLIATKKFADKEAAAAAVAAKKKAKAAPKPPSG